MLIDYTSAEAVKANTLAAIEAGVAVVIGTLGPHGRRLRRSIDAAARERSVGVVASGNFSLTAAMCQAAALLAARHLPQWEVIDYASATKPDVPSGTARELAERLGEVRPPELGHPIEDLHGPQEARGANVDGTQVHSVRLPSFVVSTEVVFGLPDERLTHPPRRGRDARSPTSPGPSSRCGGPRISSASRAASTPFCSRLRPAGRAGTPSRAAAR